MKNTLFKTTYLLITFSLVANSALAQVEVDFEQEITASSDVESSIELDITTSDDDLVVDLEAETLPTTNRFGFWWERVSFNIKTAFTRNAEKKAEIYQVKLHQYDRKLVACAELGDEECITRIDEHMDRLTTRTENFISKRAELKEKLLTRFREWRSEREQKIDDRKERALNLKEQTQELKKNRALHREQAKKDRQAHLEEIKAKREERRNQLKKDREEFRENNKENRELNNGERREKLLEQREIKREQLDELREKREQNREKLIELRSQNANDKLNATKEAIEEHGEENTEADPDNLD